MNKRFLLVVFFFFISNYAYSADWHLVTSTNTGDRYFVDRSRIEVLPDYRKAWVRENLKKAKKLRGYEKLHKETVDQVLFDCEGKRVSSLSTSYYDLEGKIIVKNDQEDKERLYKKNILKRWNSIVPDSIASNVLEFVCSYSP